MIVIIDNDDSFTYNLVQSFGELEPDIRVFRNDQTSPAEIAALKPDRIIVSPGPCTPTEAGISRDVIRELGPKIPLLGVCLGHQCIGEVYGGDIVRADRIMHGKISAMTHTGHPMFAGVDSPFEATRYHSLIVKRETCPEALEIVAETDQGEIMALAHREHPVWGLQFHPESILTLPGKQLVKNFMGLSA